MTYTTSLRLGFASIAAATLLLSGCKGREQPAPIPPPVSDATAATASDAPGTELSEPSNPDFIGRIWLASTRGAPLGSFKIFLPDRTLMMGSCVETYRISQWGVANDDIRWLEDSIPIEAKVVMNGKDQLQLKFAGIDRVETFYASEKAFVCPDMRK